jgi:threonine/homoserine/homoserine lactone efflux protein
LIFYFFQGAALALSATVMPGPFQAFLISQALKNGWKRTLPAALAPLVSDGPIIALVVFILTQTPQWFLDTLRIVGGFFLIYLARGIFLTLKISGPTFTASDSATQKTFFNAVAMNALSPNTYIFWSVLAGPILLSGWRQSASLGIGFLVGLYGTFVCCLAVFIILFATVGRLDPRVNRVLCVVSASALLVIGVYQIVVGLMAVAGSSLHI